LNRTMYIRFPEIPNEGNMPSYTLLQDAMGSVTLAPVEIADGTKAWKFTKASIDAIPLLYDYYANAPLVEGLKEEQLPELTSLWLRGMIRNNAPFLLKKAVLLENWQWIGLFLIILAGMAVGNLVILFTHHAIQHWFRRHKQEIDPKVERDFNRPIRLAVTAWAWFLGLSVLGLPPAAMGYLGVGTKLLTGIAAVWAAYRFIDIAGGYMTQVTAKTESKYDDLLVPFVTRCLKVFVITAGLIVIAETFEYDYMSLVAGLGIGGLAFALAAKDTVANLFGYITILTDRPFEVGDWITFGTADGAVESVGMRSTRIRTFHNSQVSVPNSEIINATIDNMGKRKYRRISTTLSVAYDTPPVKIDAFCEGIRQIIREHPYTRKDFYHVYLNAFGPSSLNILLYCFHETPDWSTELRERHRLFLDILHLARSLGVEFAFPTQTLFVRPDQSPEHNAVPDSRPEAVRLGRSAAGDILDKGRPWHTPPPPPVTFLGDEDPDYLVNRESDEGTPPR
jgi:MscS family membrane protein